MAKAKAKTVPVVASRPNAPVRLRATTFGYNNGRFNVGKYSMRTKEIDLAANVIQRTTGTCTLDGKLIDFKLYGYQRTVMDVRIDVNVIRDVRARIIQTEVVTAEWEVLPPFEAPFAIVQKSPVAIPATYYVGIVYLGASISQSTPAKVKAALVRDLSASCIQTTPITANAVQCSVSDVSAAIIQRTVFVPGVVAGWSPWYPINPDYPAPWDGARVAA